MVPEAVAVQAAAAGSIEITDQILKSTIVKVKEIYHISDELDKFSYDVNTVDNISIWNLRWMSSKTNENISISYGSDANTYHYYTYIPSVQKDRKSINNIKKDAAKEIAADFLKLALPTQYSYFKIVENNSIENFNGFYLQYQYYQNDVPVEGAQVYIGVDSKTGIINQYSCSFHFSLDFPSLEGIIDVSKAQEAYKSNLGLQLVYQSKINYTNDNVVLESVFPVYIEKYTADYAIDAKTGERILTSEPYFGFGRGEKGGYGANTSLNEAALSPAEEKEVKNIEGVLPVDTAVKMAFDKGIPILKKGMLLFESSLNTSPLNTKSGYVWNINLREENKEQSAQMCRITMDAKTGDIISFSADDRPQDSKGSEVKRDAAQKEVERFLKAFVPDRFSKTMQSDATPIYGIYRGEDTGRYLYFRYVRTENGVQYPDNSISITYDAIAKTICNYSIMWYESAIFPSVDKVVPTQNIYQSIFSKNPITLQYRLSTMSQSQKLFLIYTPARNQYPICFDAISGERIDYEGQVTGEQPKIGGYTDIDEYYAKEKILELSEIGIGLFTTTFAPNKSIAQKEMMYLLSQTYPYGMASQKSLDAYSEEDINAMYNDLKLKGIIKEQEIAPKSIVTREQAAKYIVRALGGGTIGEHSEIFICDFLDFDQISPDYKGFVAISKAFGIVSGDNGYFKPTDEITRGEAAVMIYRYLSQ